MNISLAFDKAWSAVLQARNRQQLTAAEITERLRKVEGPKASRSLLLFTDERTGSHYLASILASTGVLGRAYEYFNTGWMKTHYADYPETVREQFRWAQRMGTTPNGVFSLKLHPWAMDRIAGELNIGTLPNPSYVWLQRRDVLGQAISLVMAQQTGKYVATEAHQDGPVEYRGNEILSVMHNLLIRRARWSAYFARNDIKPLEYDYEDVVSNPHGCVAEIRRLVGIRERAIIGRVPWYQFQPQKTQVNDTWRARFLHEYRDTGALDVIRPETLNAHNGQRY